MSAPAGLFFYGERCTVPDMPVWKLEPINPDDEHWTASRYVGPLFVRAADDDGARKLAAMACGIGKGKLSLKQVGANLFGRQMMILYETYEIGADTGRVMYGHEGEEGGIVLSGRVEITVGAERKILGPGDAYYFDSRAPHRFRQIGPEKCVLVSACTPPTF